MASKVATQPTAHEHPEQTAFWRRRIADHPEPTVLPRDFLGQDSEQPLATWAVAIGTETATELRRITRNEPALTRAVHTAALAVAVGRATDTDVVSVVTSASDGSGYFPLAVSVDPGSSVKELLAAVRTEYLEASGHLDVPVGPLFEQAGLAPSDLLIDVDGDGLAAADFPWTIRFDVRRNVAELTYRADLFTTTTARRLAHAYARVLDAVRTDPDVPLGEVLQADEEERAQLAKFNSTEAEFPADTALHGFLEAAAAATPTRVAIVDDGTTYSELNRRANRLAHRLRALGVGRGAVVGVCLPRSPLELTTLYAVLKTGAAYLPVDPTLPAGRIAYVLSHSRTRIVLGDASTRHAVAAAEHFLDVSDPAVYASEDGNPEAGTRPDDLAYVIYTSGSTGRPKGVMIEHRAIVNRLVWMQRAYPLSPDDVILHKTPFTFDVSVWEIFWWSLAGAAVCTLPSGEERDPERICARVAEHGVTTAHFVPSMLQAFLGFVEADGEGGRLATLRQVFASGEALATTQVSAFDDLLGGPHGTALINLYGPTEAAVDVTHFHCAEADPARAVPIGRPIDNIRLHVLTRSGGLAPIGTPGELHIAGVGLARGYLNSADLTEERFIPDPHAPGERRYKTGDLARWLPDGTIEYLGRLDTQVKIRGYRIELGEIEHVAARYPAVRECAVTAIEDDAGDRTLCAYVVPGGGFREAELRELLAAELPEYMVPAHVVTVPAIPTNHNGKRDLKSLPHPPRGGQGAAGFVAPGNPAEELLARIWCQVLGLERVGVRDNFFALGGDSIKFIGVLARARRAGLDFSFQDLFAHPTIAELAGLARQTDGDHTTTPPFGLLDTGDRDLLPEDAVDAYPLSALQAGLLYEVARSGGGGLYHDVAAYRVQDTLDLDVFREAVRAVVEHHAVFRTSFHPTGFSTPIQIVHATAPLPLEVVDLSALSEEDQEARLAEYRARELERGFGTGTTGLVRIAVHLLGERGYQYSLSYHAAALDGWSVGTVHRDLFTAYFALLDGAQPRFPHCDTTYGDYVRLEREAAASAEQREFWAERLEGAEATRLPRWDASAVPKSRQPEVIMHDVLLPADVSAGVLQVAESLRVPVKSVLLAAHTAVMGFLSGTDDVLTGYEHSGRPEAPGAEHLPGLFLNTIPFRARLEPGTWADLIRHVYEAETALLPARRHPMAELKRRLGVREALFESVFNFTHFHVLKDLVHDHGFELVRHDITSRTEFPFRAEFWQDALTDEVHLQLHHHDGRFPPEQIERIAGYYARALELITACTDHDRGSTTLLGAEELHLLNAEFAGADLDLPPGTAVDLIDAQVRARPDAVAVSHRGHHLSYAELDSASDRVAVFLRAAGVGDGDVVAMPMDRGLPWAVSVLGVFKAGAVHLPQDPSDPPDRLAAMIRRSGCLRVLTTAEHADRLGPIAPTVLRYEDVPGDATTPVSRPGPEDPAYVIFTSGSTGEPKGALIHHRGMLNHLQAKIVDLGLGDGDVVAQLATQCFDISVWQLLVAWLTGGHTVIYDKEAVSDLTGFLNGLEQDGITVLEVVPSYLDALLGAASSHRHPLPELRWTLVTGETLPPALTRRWFATYDIPLVNAYGPTEASDDVTHHVITGPVDSERVPIGRPIVNTRLYVVGPDDQVLPIGSYGEICVTGVGVGRGYVNDPEATARAFRPNSLDSASPMLYRTGDIGRWLPSGVLDCVGRADHQVKVRGFRIELSEIEGALTRLPGVDQAVVLVRSAARERLLTAFCTGPAVPGLQETRAALAATLPAYMLPDLVLPLDALPLTRNGKADRTALELHPLPGRASGPDRVPPADDAEAALLAEFAEVLGVGTGELSVTDDFFDVGGHSLAAMKLTARLGRGLALRDVLNHPTVRSLARRLATGASSARPLLTELLSCADPQAALVCVPYAGGGAAAYLPLARSLRSLGVRVQVLAADLPGRSQADPRPESSAAELGQELAEEIAASTSAPVVLLGHCAGSGPVLAAGAALRRMGRPPEHLLVVAKVLGSRDPHAYAEDDVSRMTDDEVIDWLDTHTGLPGLDAMSRVQRRDLARSFRYDSRIADQVYAEALADPSAHNLGCPLTVALADDDLVTRGREHHAGNWALFGTEVDVTITDRGGHHLNATRPEFLAACVWEAIRTARRRR